MSKLFRNLSVVLFAAVIAAWSVPMLRAADAPEAGKGTIKGVLYDADHKPVSGAGVRLFSESEHPTTAPAASARSAAPAKLDDAPTPAKKPHSKPIAETTTDANGAFTFTDVAAGKYIVGAGSKETGHARGSVTVTAGATATVDLTIKAKKPA